MRAASTEASVATLDGTVIPTASKSLGTFEPSSVGVLSTAHTLEYDATANSAHKARVRTRQ